MAILESPVDETITLVNRTKSYTVSKKLLFSSIPYFKKLLSDRLTESKEEKIQVDFHLTGFHNIMMSVIDGVFNITMGIVLPTLNLSGYLGMEELQQKCEKFFHENFTLKHLPVVLKSLDNCGNFPAILGVDSLSFFIEKYFLKIASASTFLNFPIETIEFICKLNLIVDSEYQVFQAIKRWIDANQDRLMPDDRKNNLERLFNCFCWCHADQKEIYEYMSTHGFNTDRENVNCRHERCENQRKEKSLIVIHKIDDTTIRISSYDEDLHLFVANGFLTLDESIPHELITKGRFSEIIYDSGRKGIRVDWTFRKFNYLNMIGKKDSHYGKILKYIFYEDSNVKNTNSREIHLEGERYSKRNNICVPGLTVDSIVDDVTGYKLITFCGDLSLTCIFLDVYNWTEFKLKSNLSTQSLQIGTTLCLIFQNPTLYFYRVKYNEKRCDLKNVERSSIGDMIKSINGIEEIVLANHRGKLLLCHRLSGKICCYNDSTDDWELLYQIEMQQEIIAIVSIVLPPN